MSISETFKENHNRAMDTALRLLTRRNHTVYELKQKLIQRGFGPGAIEKVISECERLRYLNDEEAGRMYLRELRAKGYGIRGIRFSMKKKGLGNDLIDSLLSGYDDADELETARRAAAKKLPSFNREKNIRKRKEKIYRFLYSRGFSPSVISEIIRELTNPKSE